MRVTLDRKLRVNIEGIEGDDLVSFMNMVRGAALQERRVWFPVLRELDKKPIDKLPFPDSLVLAKEVKKMRSLQSQYFKTRSQDALKASIEQESKVDALVSDILDRQ